MALTKHSVRTVRRPCSKCGTSELYWAHDTEGKFSPSGRFCTEHQSGSWVLINRDGGRHDCQHNGSQDHGEPEPAETGPVMYWTNSGPEPLDPEPEPEPTAPATAPTATAASAGNDAFTAFQAFMATMAPKVDASQVDALITERLRGLVLPVQVEIIRNGVVKPIEGLTHKTLPDVIDILADGDHVMMVGPAGTGKSHIAGQAAEALGLPAYSISLSPQTPTSALLGYMTATGEYVRSLFREAYENGGVFHFDEVDNSHPAVLATINAALANGHMAFPDGMIKRHDDFRSVASANTYGNGPDRQFVGRQAMDAATKDRFEIVDIHVDEALETALCLATGLDTARVADVVTYVRYLRRMASTAKLSLDFSPRRSRSLCKRLAKGWTPAKAIGVSVRRGISDADWSKVAEGAPRI
jgi:cobaltochelatase CobS